ncbi:MAG: LamG domain-containing protein, partial [Chloroflexia bacterium]
MWRIRVFLLATFGVLLAGLLSIFLSADKAANARLSLASPTGVCITPPAGMVAWYPLDETSGNTMTDLTGTYTGTYFNNPAINLGHYVLNSRIFDGVNQYGEAPTGPNFGTGDFTIDAWINLTSTGAQILVDKRSVTPIGYMLFVAGGSLGIQIADGNGQPSMYIMSGSPLINDGQWHFVAAVVQRIGQNRVSLTTDSTIQNFNNAPIGSLNNTNGLRIARSWANNLDPVEHYYNGVIDEVELFNRALSETDLGNIRSAGVNGKCKGPTQTPTPTITETS